MIFYLKKFISFCSLMFLLTIIFLFFIFEIIMESNIFHSSGFESILRIATCLLSYIIPLLILLFFYRKKFNKYKRFFIFIVVCIYYWLIFFLSAYLILISNFFDLDFFIENSRDAFFTIQAILGSLKLSFVFLFLLFFSALLFVSVNFLIIKKESKRKILKYILIIFLILFLFMSIFQIYFKYEKCAFNSFIVSLFGKNDQIYKYYNTDFKNFYYKFSNFDNSQFFIDNQEDLPDVYFIHLESVNGGVLGESIIPNFEEYSENHGVLFTNFLSNSVLTLKAQESILCALPPSSKGYFQYQFDASKIFCLPKILSKFGYKTLFFKSHSLEFSQTGKFMLDIGFEETHNHSIMQEGDLESKWGYREDVFYQRVLEYLQGYKDNRKFVYVAVSTTNHYPFITSEDISDLPIKNPKNITDNIKNAIYVQDKYLKVILEGLLKDEKYKYIFLFSDHSWPLGYHDNNEFNQGLSYMENFHIPFAFLIFGKDESHKFDIGGKRDKIYSQIDFLKTLLDLLNIKTENQYLGNSFYCELLKDSNNCDVNTCTISNQPYSDKYVTFFYDNKHYLYNIKRKVAFWFDLEIDKNEENPIHMETKEFINLYDKCKKIMNY